MDDVSVYVETISMSYPYLTQMSPLSCGNALLASHFCVSGRDRIQRRRDWSTMTWFPGTTLFLAHMIKVVALLSVEEHFSYIVLSTIKTACVFLPFICCGSIELAKFQKFLSTRTDWSDKVANCSQQTRVMIKSKFQIIKRNSSTL